MRYALSILKLIILCILTYFAVLYWFLISSIRTGTAYSSCGSIPPLYIAFRASCLRLQLILAELDDAFISFVHLSVMNFVCYVNLNFSLLSCVSALLCLLVRNGCCLGIYYTLLPFFAYVKFRAHTLDRQCM